MRKTLTDRERLDLVKKYRMSGLNTTEFCKVNDLKRGTFRDWVRAYNHLQGDFVRLPELDDEPGKVYEENNVRVNMLKSEEIKRKSAHFTRFDHSIVVIELKGLKLTTSLEQTLAILDRIYDRL
ncbi:hypothetical protein N7603_08890 [Acholeplasma vituli]|jgi:transposase-like protein|uniref:Transposase n=1 Tax=Paracholeplasma vituli TaxID=69473 RepID=A0ABT2PXS9_9MOLU|nr:hypothetical protein [Paracholeplasma vituli]MCU0105760.1 hypothetical protein [Paracholeplasma vituli]